MSLRTLQIDDRLFEYVPAHSAREHTAQAALREATRDHPHAGMQIAPDEGQFMALLVKLLDARRTIEIGTFTGCSALAVGYRPAVVVPGRFKGVSRRNEFDVYLSVFKYANTSARSLASGTAKYILTPCNT